MGVEFHRGIYFAEFLLWEAQGKERLIQELHAELHSIFGLDSFRPGQEEIISSVMEKKDVLAVMPTGGGKSLCFQLPAMLLEGITIVISPLIALMNDQVKNLKDKGIPAGCIHSGLSVEEKRVVFTEMKNSKSFLLYLSPERTQHPGFLNWIKEQKIALIAIDEAHCVSQWGHDFRPEYSQIAHLRAIKPEAPMVALTATATPIVKNDIIRQLSLQKPDQHVYGFYRPNLYYQVEFCEHESDKEGFVLGALKRQLQGKVIIYCGTRKKTEQWNEFLMSHGFSSGFYHAGLSADQRKQIESDYKRGEIRVLAATNAFGMGIDHPDVRLVIHTQVPGNVESYYQEIGRAGRDGEESTCLLVYSKRDKGLQSFFIQSSDAEQRIKNMRWDALNAMIDYSESSECRHGDILTYFKDVKRIRKCGHCDSCDPFSERRVRAISMPNTIKKKKKKPSELLDAQLSNDQKWQLEKIREWRRDYAKEHDIPAFIVFNDKTLKDLILKSPKTEDELRNVYGLGEKKIEVFGAQLLEELTYT